MTEQPCDAPAAAWAAAEAIRALNHLATGRAGQQGFHDPDDLYGVLGGLTALVQRLDQSATQISRWTAHASRHGRIVTATSSGSRDAAGTVQHALCGAADSLRAAADHLNMAWAASGDLAAVPPIEGITCHPQLNRPAAPDVGL